MVVTEVAGAMGGGNISTWPKNFVLSICLIKHRGDGKERTSMIS